MAEDFCSSLHPLTPPLKEEERLSWLRLIRSRKVGPATFHRLMKDHGSADAALEVLPEIASEAGINDYSVYPVEAAQRELKAGKLAGARLIACCEATYPRRLREISDAPPLIWAIGEGAALSKPMIAMVGARNSSSLGTRMARKIAADLGDAGFVVVSGLARGIDTSAHLGALDGGTVAVVAGGVDILYPAENADLAKKIETKGARISECPMGLQPRARHFPQRNRLISGMSEAVVVVEAAAQSGSLITAKNALDQGRDVLAVPGHPFDGRAAGGNMLIRDGATLIRSAADILDVIQPTQQKPAPHLFQPPKIEPSSGENGAVLAQMILDKLGPSPVAEDQLIRDLGRSAAEVAPELVMLEVDGRIQRAPGGLVSLAAQSAD